MYTVPLSLSFFFFAARTMSRVEDIRKQLVSILDRYKMDVSNISFFFFSFFIFYNAQLDVLWKVLTHIERNHVCIHAFFFFFKIITCGRDFNLVRMAIVSGYFTNAAKRDPQEGYRTMTEGQVVYMHPCKSLFFPCT